MNWKFWLRLRKSNFALLSRFSFIFTSQDSCDARLTPRCSLSVFTHNRLFLISRSLNDWFGFQSFSNSAREWCNLSWRERVKSATENHRRAREEKLFPREQKVCDSMETETVRSTVHSLADNPWCAGISI